MPTDNVQITSPVRIDDDSRQRVSLDLALWIARHEELGGNLKPDKQDRIYWVNLYADCLHVVNGHRPPAPATAKTP